jgi:hypothetical protein
MHLPIEPIHDCLGLSTNSAWITYGLEIQIAHVWKCKRCISQYMIAWDRAHALTAFGLDRQGPMFWRFRTVYIPFHMQITQFLGNIWCSSVYEITDLVFALVSGFSFAFIGFFFLFWAGGGQRSQSYLKIFVFDSSSCAGTVASSGPSGWCLRDLFLCSSFFSPLAKRLFLFLQTFVVPEWEPVGTAACFCSVSSFWAS